MYRRVRQRILQNESKLKDWENQSRKIGIAISEIQTEITKIDTEQEKKNEKSRDLSKVIRKNQNFLNNRLKN